MTHIRAPADPKGKPAVTMPAAVPDPLDNIEPTDDEIAAAAADERRDAERETRAAKKAAPPKRGPGRPPGAKNRSKTEATARAAGKKTTVAPTKPLTGAAASSSREAAARRRAERRETVDAWVREASEFRPQLVGAVGLVTGIPAHFLIGLSADDRGRPLDVEGKPLKLDGDGQPLPGQNPATALTHYGEALAPTGWQIKIGAEAAVRLADSDEGERLLELWEKHAPKIYGVAALGAVVVYTISTLQAVNAIKPLVKMEIEQQVAAAQAAQAASEGETPGGASAGPTG